MVLSNKKLKQKLRAEFAEKTAKPQSQNNSAGDARTNSEPQQSLKQLLDSAGQRPRLSKREKRRTVHTSEHPEAAKEGSDGGGAEDEKVEAATVKDGSEGLGKKKKDKKRRREVELGNGVVEDAKKSQKKHKKKKKKPKQKKPKTEAGNRTDAGGNLTGVTGCGGNVTEVTELSKSSSSQGNGNDPTKVYVGGMPYYSSEDDIRSYFDSCGTITEVDCMTFPDSGKFRGIAIISFKTEAAAKRALALDGADMGGFFLKMLPYKTTRATKLSSDYAPEMVEGYNRIYAGNLSWDITEDELKKFFSDCNISSIRFGMNKDTGEFAGYAHVDFSDSKSLKSALSLDQKVLFGRPVRIRCAVPLKKPEGQTSHASSGGQPSSVSGKIRGRTCYECGEKGHLSSACPRKQTVDSTASCNL